MNTNDLILFPVTHEQTLPTFHVRHALHGKFVEFLCQEGVKIAEPPEHIEGTEMTEVLLEAGTPSDQLHALKERFLAANREESAR